MPNKISKSVHPSFQLQLLTEPYIICHYFDNILIQVSVRIFYNLDSLLIHMNVRISYDFDALLTSKRVKISCGKAISEKCDHQQKDDLKIYVIFRSL